MAKITSYYVLDTCWAFISIAATKSKHKIVRAFSLRCKLLQQTAQYLLCLLCYGYKSLASNK